MVKKYYELVDGKSSKFWEIEIKPRLKVINVRYGKIGHKETTKGFDFPTTEKTKDFFNKKLAEKTKKGYLEKDSVRWFPVNKKQNINNFRNYFKKMFKYMIDNHDDIVKRCM